MDAVWEFGVIPLLNIRGGWNAYDAGFIKGITERCDGPVRPVWSWLVARGPSSARDDQNALGMIPRSVHSRVLVQRPPWTHGEY